MTNKQQHLILVGFMASGKSTLGKASAELLGWPFIDLDHWIEQQVGMTIPEIFTKQGEVIFRQWEREALLHVQVLPTPHVVATGGGLPCQGYNMDYLLTLGKVIFLNLDRGVLLERLHEMRADRPMLSKVPATELDAHIEQLMTHRLPFYQRAHHTLEQGQLTPQHLTKLAPGKTAAPDNATD